MVSLGVAAHKLNLKAANFETGFSLYRLKGWVTGRFQATGQLSFQLVQAPPQRGVADHRAAGVDLRARG
jgi:hypothetical protein